MRGDLDLIVLDAGQRAELSFDDDAVVMRILTTFLVISMFSAKGLRKRRS